VFFKSFGSVLRKFAVIDLKSEADENSESQELESQVRALTLLTISNTATENERSLLRQATFRLRCFEAQDTTKLVSSDCKFSRQSLIDDEDDD